MEESALTVTVFLTSLIIPISLGAVILGILTVAKGLGGFRIPQDAELAVVGTESTGGQGNFLLERVAAGLCATVGVVLILVLGVNMGRSGRASPWTAVLLVLILLLPTPAILWNTRYRVVGEGIATIAIAGTAILTGFSIGFLFVPVIVLMIWLCITLLRRPNHYWEGDPSSG